MLRATFQNEIPMKKTFYGWWVLLALFLTYAASNGIGLYAFGVLRKMQSADLGIDPARNGVLPGILFFTVAVMSMFVGWMLDRYSPRLILAVGSIGVVATVFGQMFVSSYEILMVYYVVFGLVMSLAGIISCMFLVNRWFHRYKGMAAGILVVGSSVGGIVFPTLAAKAGNWHTASLWLGGMALIFVIPSLFIVKDSPEDLNLFPDGSETTPNSANTEGSIVGVTLAEALKTPSFYLVLIVTGSLWFCINGYLQHNAFFCKDLGMDEKAAAGIIGLASTMAILGKLSFGYLSDRIDKKMIMALSLGIMAISLLILKGTIANPSLLKIFASVFGLGFGGAFAIIQIWVADIYAGKSFGAILGVVTMVDTLVGMTGITSLGFMRKASGSYESSINLMIGLCGVALVCTFLVKKPEKSA